MSSPKVSILGKFMPMAEDLFQFPHLGPIDSIISRAPSALETTDDADAVCMSRFARPTPLRLTATTPTPLRMTTTTTDPLQQRLLPFVRL